MMENNNSVTVGPIGILTIVFVVLKLTKVINWSWLWVLSPLWISFGLALIVFIIYIIIYIISVLIGE